jgi:dipeptidyl aminopeptidase/acylaminoacyl peptidase
MSRYLRAHCAGAIVLGLILLAGGSASAAGRTLQLEDYASISTVSDPQISPDGRSIAFVVARPNLEQDSSDKRLMLVGIATGRQRTLTYDRKLVSFLRWSPTGDRLAFLALDTSAKKPQLQVFVLPLSGGEAQRITAASSGIEQFAWRPNGREIAYVTADEPKNPQEVEKHHDAFEVGDNDYLATSASEPSHLWLVPAEGGTIRRLSSGPWSVAKSTPPVPASPINWSADGRFLIFTRQAQPQSGDGDRTTLQILDAETGAVHKLTGHGSLEGFGQFSPDASRAAYRYARDGDGANENEVYVAPVTGGDGASATRALDRNILRSVWMPDGNSLLVGGNDGTQVSLWLQPIGGRAHRLTLGEVSPAAREWIELSVSRNGAIAFPGATPTHPSELYYMASAAQAPTQMTQFNDEIAQLELGEAEEFDWEGPDHFHEDGVVFYPPGFDRHRKAPLVVYTHGGPTAATTRGFSLLPQFLARLLAAHGYVVFAINYRGSDNLGNAYQRAIYNDAGEGPGRDVMAGIAALEKLGFIDESKIAPVGISYGGYMSAWLIGHYSIWKTAIIQDGVIDWLDQYNLSDLNVMTGDAFPGSPYIGDNLRGYREQSPIAHVEHIKTPTLIVHNTGDVRVPIPQAYALYHALKDNGVPVTFIAYPIASHVAFDPVHVMDYYQLWVDWLDRHLK